jgi:hypothetical protein
MRHHFLLPRPSPFTHELTHKFCGGPGNVKVNHWPVGGVNSEGTVARDKDLDKYPFHICPVSLFLVKELRRPHSPSHPLCGGCWIAGQEGLHKRLTKNSPVKPFSVPDSQF